MQGNEFYYLVLVLGAFGGFGLAVAIAVIRGLAHRRAPDARDGERPVGLGSFWVDIVRACLYVLLPISLLAALVLDAAGYELVIIETVGVGQGEVEHTEIGGNAAGVRRTRDRRRLPDHQVGRQRRIVGACQDWRRPGA